MPFVFRLQPVLNIKKQVEENMKNELGKSIQRLETEKLEHVKIVTYMNDCIGSFNEQSTKGVTIDRLREYSAYLPVLKEKLEKQKRRVIFAEQEVDMCRQSLIKAVQEREILDKLKEKRKQEFREEELRSEQKIIDELVSYKTGLISNE